MTDLADNRSTRRLQVAALVAAPLAGLATTLTWPATPLDTAARLEVLVTSPGRKTLAHVLNLLTIVLFVPALAGMHRLLHAHRRRAAATGTGLVAVGLVGWSGVLALSSAELQVARTASGSDAVAVAESLQQSPVSAAMLVMFLLGMFIGLVVLTTALWRAGAVSGWVPAAVGVAVVGDAVASTVTAVVVTVWVLLTCALVAVARARAGRATAPNAPRSEPALARP